MLRCVNSKAIPHCRQSGLGDSHPMAPFVAYRDSQLPHALERHILVAGQQHTGRAQIYPVTGEMIAAPWERDGDRF